VTAALTVAGSLLGLVRDQAVAHLFGAGAESDAFLVAWTVPEIAATVLIEDAMALLMVPAFSAALARGTGTRPLVRGTLPRLLALLAVLTAGLAAGAPLLVGLLAPGLADPRTAVACTRLTALTVFTFGLAGYVSAALRAHRRFVPPAAIYVAYNVGIVATLLALHGRYGVRAAAAGVAVGGALMVLVQLPSFAATLRRRPAPGAADPHAEPPTAPTLDRTAAPGATAPHTATLHATADRTTNARATADRTATPRTTDQHTTAPHATADRTTAPHATTDRSAEPHTAAPARGDALRAALLLPVVVFTVGRQAQVLLERFFAAPLPAGAISHLNYAQKVAQLPMVLSLMVCTVTFPAVSRALALGDRERARRRVERDLTLAGVVVLVGAAYVVACAPAIVRVLFQRGEFGPSDTAATAAVMRVYALGLLGQTMVGALIRPYFSAARPTWYPALSMAAGLLVTAAGDAAAVRPWGACGIAAGNAAGITVTAALLLRGIGTHSIAVRARALAPGFARIALAALAATAAAWALSAAVPGALAAALLGGLAVPAVFAAAALALRAPEVPSLLATVTRKARP
jgi:putative peptidoglycan lipid II flippase